MPDKRRSAKREKVTITLPAYLIDDVDDLAGETDQTRSDVIEALLEYSFAKSAIIDEIFPYEEEDDSEEETEGEEES